MTSLLVSPTLTGDKQRRAVLIFDINAVFFVFAFDGFDRGKQHVGEFSRGKLYVGVHTQHELGAIVAGKQNADIVSHDIVDVFRVGVNAIDLAGKFIFTEGFNGDIHVIGRSE